MLSSRALDRVALIAWGLFGFVAGIGIVLLLWRFDVLDRATPAPSPSVSRAEEVSVAFAVATGWPHSATWSHVVFFASAGDVITVRTTLSDGALNAAATCDQVAQLDDDVMPVGHIERVDVTGLGRTVLATCKPSVSEIGTVAP